MNVNHYIGFDVHKKTINSCVKMADGQIVEEGRLRATHDALRQWAGRRREPVAWRHGSDLVQWLEALEVFCRLYKKGPEPAKSISSRDQVRLTGAGDPARFEARQIATSAVVRRDLDREHPFREAVSSAWRLTGIQPRSRERTIWPCGSRALAVSSRWQTK